MRRAFYAILIIALLLMSCVHAYGADRAYFQPEMWINNPQIYSENINKKSNSYTLEGVFKYYFDAQNNIFYTYFSISETSLSENRCDIRLVYTVDNIFDTYSLSVNKEGICDTSYTSQDYFSTEQSFTTYKESNSGLYLSSIAINTGCIHNNISIKLYINGHMYKIVENIPLDMKTESEAVSKNEITENTYDSSTVNDNKTKNNTTSKSITSKNTTSSTKNEKSTREKTATTTKFHYNPNAGTYNSTSKQQNNKDATDATDTTDTTDTVVTASTVYDSTSQEAAKENKGTVSSAAKTCCMVSGVCATSGISFLLASAIKKSKKLKGKE